jgi:catechol 2,3-dioxygenase-like lactoylglutathione lyase family enzyme
MTTATTAIGLERLRHPVLWGSDPGRGLRFYRDVLGFEVKTRSAEDPDGLEFEVSWAVHDGRPARTEELDLERGLARRGVPVA